MNTQAHPDPSAKFAAELDKTVKMMTAPGKGLLAADESTSTIGKRFQSINVENIEANRQAYRELLFSVSAEASKFISGVILYEETLFQKTKDGKEFVKVLQEHGIVPGIKVDEGIVPLGGSKGSEPVTQGLDNLEKRVQKYYNQGARFAKWRAVININKDSPSDYAIRLNCDLLARYATICQQNGLVPIVEPEILVMEGDHDIEVSLDVTTRVLGQLYKSLNEQGVALERTILKPNMVLPGDKCSKKATVQQVAEYTLKALRRTVPPAVPGIMFLSGGQTEEQAAQHLDAMCKMDAKLRPWALSFSYGRALQHSALDAWRGKPENVQAGQKAYLAKSEACYKAALGQL